MNLPTCRSFVLALGLAAVSAPLHAQRSYAMRFECRTAEPNTPASRRRAEEFVRDKLKAFVPAPEQALRMRALEAEAEQVKLAFYGISTTCEQFLRGTMERDVADNSLQGLRADDRQLRARREQRREGGGGPRPGGRSRGHPEVPDRDRQHRAPGGAAGRGRAGGGVA
jgi:hypothetical protein